MGCGSSSVVGASTDSLNNANEKRNNNKNIEEQQNTITNNHKGKREHGEKDSFDGEHRPDSRSTYRDSGIDSAKTSDGRRAKQNAGENHQNSKPNGVHRPVAFDIVLDENSGQSIIKKHPPKRLQVLKPKETPLTAEMLKEKLQLSEERRREELQKRAKSARRTSKRRKEIMAAREYEKEQQEQQSKQISDKLDSANRQRQKAQNERIAKQKLREERARQARERAKRLDQAHNDELNYEVERDDTFNASDDADSWLDGYNPNDDNTQGSAVSSTSERIYDGRSSPVKRYNPLTSAEARKRQLLGTNDRDDVDFDQGNQWARKSYDHDGTPKEDEFFDS
ncbi:arginine and glutamate-rich protein 1-like [Ptychodera flava]|uniref:arginine and glutamate-rich protein 1-like n=1 Tax=Ptychodera flava TaxID=63121 RepID=UPI00396A31A5